MKPIPILGTTHADYFLSDIPLAKELEINDLEQYEKSLGQSVVDYFQEQKINPLNIPAILLPKHGVMVFSDSPDRTLECAIVLEEIAEMAYYTTNINRSITDEFDEFTRLSKDLAETSILLAGSIDSIDDLRPALKGVSSGCKACHSQYRE